MVDNSPLNGYLYTMETILPLRSVAIPMQPSTHYAHPEQVTHATLLKVVVQAFPVLITLVSVYGNRMAVTITVRLRGNCRGTPIPTA